MHWFWFLIVGIVAGWLAGKLTRGHGFGLVGNLVVGIIGALVGGFIFRLIGVISFGLSVPSQPLQWELSCFFGLSVS
jgi:uncharacterized membrane protein YeaQ/YmgE (transglycosylase-associated protein family)